jgi:uroporphyrinogen-III synthase
MVTRPADQSADLYFDLRQLGAEPMPFPTIATESFHDEPGWEAVKDCLDKDAWLVFTSENGVRYFFDQFVSRFGDIRYLGRFKIAAIGTGTSRALMKYHLEPDFVPSRSTVEVLSDEMKKMADIKGATLIRIRGNLANDHMEKTMPETGVTVIPLTVYRTFHPDWPDGLKEKLFDTPPHAILFTSASTVKGLSHNLTEDEIKQITTDAKIFSLGPMVSETLRKRGFELTREATPHDLPGMIATLLDFYQKK